MPFYSGQQGQLIIGTKKAAKVQNWSFQSSQAVLETTSLGDTDRTLVGGTRSLSGSCRLFYYQDSPGSGGDASTLINSCIKPSASGAANSGVAAESDSVWLELLINDGTSTGRYIKFACYLTSISMAMAVGEVFSADVSFEANGAPAGMSL